MTPLPNSPSTKARGLREFPTQSDHPTQSSPALPSHQGSPQPSLLCHGKGSWNVGKLPRCNLKSEGVRKVLLSLPFIRVRQWLPNSLAILLLSELLSMQKFSDLKISMASGYSPPSDSAVAGGEAQPTPMGLRGGGWPWEITHSHRDRGTEKGAATTWSGQMSYWATCVSRHLFYKLLSCLLYTGIYLQYFRIIGSSAFLHSICAVSYFTKKYSG